MNESDHFQIVACLIHKKKDDEEETSYTIREQVYDDDRGKSPVNKLWLAQADNDFCLTIPRYLVNCNYKGALLLF